MRFTFVCTGLFSHRGMNESLRMNSVCLGYMAGVLMRGEHVIWWLRERELKTDQV